ncbi:hypothetical protein Peur_004393 [Populus x canadensis]
MVLEQTGHFLFLPLQLLLGNCHLLPTYSSNKSTSRKDFQHRPAAGNFLLLPNLCCCFLLISAVASPGWFSSNAPLQSLDVGCHAWFSQ